MTYLGDPTQRWSRELDRLRSQADRLRRKAGGATTDNLTEDALTLCDSLLRDLAGAHHEIQELRSALQQESSALAHLFDTAAVPCVLTDVAGTILKANDAAGRFLNVSPRHLAGRELLLFTSDRNRLTKILTELQLGDSDQRAHLAFRPRERRARTVVASVTAARGQRPGWLWFLVPSEEAQPETQVLTDAHLTPTGVADDVSRA